jgi:hypothetical protein
MKEMLNFREGIPICRSKVRVLSIQDLDGD